MTCIVALKTKKYLYIGGERFASDYYTGRNINNPKVFKKGNMLFGYTTSFRFGQILEKYLEIPTDTRELTIDYIIMDLVPNIRKILEEHKYSATDNKGISGNAIICYKNSIFQLQSDWSVLEYDDYDSVGSGESLAKGALYCLNNIDTNITPEDRIKLAIRAAAYHITSVDDEHIDILKVKI